MNWRRWVLRPSLWVALGSILAYWDEDALRGHFIYDDDGSIRLNPVVNGRAPWTDVFTHDFWGTHLKDVQSHKSFRPVTTLSFRLNWLLFPLSPEEQGDKVPGEDRTKGTYSFHVVNVVLHGIVSGLVTEASWFIFRYGGPEDWIGQIVTGFIFGLHPVHCEAVSNVTSRGELLMSLFFLLAFLSYASQIHSGQQPGRSLISFSSIYVIPWICMTLSLFSKEQGASTLITLVVFDFLHNHFSVFKLAQSMYRGEDRAFAFVRRSTVLAMETLIVCGWRYWLNGETKPDFIFDQNPAGFAADRFTRAFSVSWVYCLYIRDAFYPQHLSVDWSGRSIPLITELGDIRAIGVLALWLVAALCVISMLIDLPSRYSLRMRFYRTAFLNAFTAFLFCPFLLSSNIFVVVGLMKGDRVIYLPLMGFCILEGMVVRYFCSPPSNDFSRQYTSWHDSSVAKICHAALALQALLFCRKVHERNIAWSEPLRLWMSAYEINPVSHHTIYNCGYNLSLEKRYEEAEQVLRPIGSADVDSTTTTFVYAMTLQNLERCDEAMPLIERALEVVDERRATGGARNSEESTARAESNLLVAKSFCVDEIKEKANALYKAVQIDPSNNYAMQQAKALNDAIEQDQRMKQYMRTH